MLRFLANGAIWVCLAIFITVAVAPIPAIAASFKFPKLSSVTGGSIRLPYSLQPGDRGNIYLETFYKVSLPVWKTDSAKVSVFFRGFYSKDSQFLTFNNRNKTSVGISYSRKIHKTFSIDVSVQYDWDYRPLSGRALSGVRANISYFYYKSRWRNMPNGHKGLFRQKSWIQAWGSMTFPESLETGNKNLAFITGGEIATAYVLPKWKLQYVPFAELTFAKDSYHLTFNSKIVPAVGFKFRRPIKNGEIKLGVKYAIDRRWIIGTTEQGTVVFGGWYKSF